MSQLSGMQAVVLETERIVPMHWLMRDGRGIVLPQPLPKHRVQGERPLYELLVGFQACTGQAKISIGPGDALLLESRHRRRLP